MYVFLGDLTADKADVRARPRRWKLLVSKYLLRGVIRYKGCLLLAFVGFEAIVPS